MEPANVKRNALSTALVFCFLVALGISSRLIQDFVEAIPPNFHAVTAVALFAGFTFRRAATAACVPLVAMMMSDAVIGGHHPLVMAAVYASLAFPVAWRVWLRGSLTPWSVGAPLSRRRDSRRRGRAHGSGLSGFELECAEAGREAARGIPRLDRAQRLDEADSGLTLPSCVTAENVVSQAVFAWRASCDSPRHT
jgi:hypothetical protein